MLKTRDYLQENSIDIGTSGTKTYNLDFQDPISELDLFFEATNGATSNIASPIERCISKIEIVDGGKVMWDAPGEVALALFAHDAGQMPYTYISEIANDAINQVIPIRFGRWLWDRDFAFNPLRFNHPQLRFTFNEAAVNTAGATGFVSDSWKFSLTVRLMEGLSAPPHFLNCRNIETFTSAASGIKRVELPVDMPIRYLISRAYESGTSYTSTWTNHKLSVNGGQYVPFDLPATDFVNIIHSALPPLSRRVKANVADNTAWVTYMGSNHWTVLVGSNYEYIYDCEIYGDGRIHMYITKHDGTGGITSRQAFIDATGWGMHNTYMWPFGERYSPDDWFVPPPQGTLDLFVTEGNDTADCDICLQQVYRD